MTANKGFKRRVRARAARTGETYQAAYHRLQARSGGSNPTVETDLSNRRVRVAINALPLGPGVPTASALEAQADRIVEAIERSAIGGARVTLFSEGALTSPHKRLMSQSSPEVDESDWTKADWPALRAQLVRIATAAHDHRVWVALGAIHELRQGRRPHTCMYVISDSGELVTRYDKRRLSTTEITYMYTPGTEPVIVDVDGVRIGFVLGLEVLFPDLFTAYADDHADLIVAASNGGGIFEQLVTSYALVNGVPIALVVPPLDADPSRSGIYGPAGVITAAEDPGESCTLFANIKPRDTAPTFHYKARCGLYNERLLYDEPRSLSRNAF